MSQRPIHGQSLRLRITSDPANLAPVRQQLEDLAAACGFDEASRGQIVLCTNEALTNVTRHAYDGAVDQPIEIHAGFAAGVLRITIRDWGSGRMPPECPPPRNPLQPGGVGMVCLRELMDSARFEPQPDGMLLVLEKRLSA